MFQSNLTSVFIIQAFNVGNDIITYRAAIASFSTSVQLRTFCQELPYTLWNTCPLCLCGLMPVPCQKVGGTLQPVINQKAKKHFTSISPNYKSIIQVFFQCSQQKDSPTQQLPAQPTKHDLTPSGLRGVPLGDVSFGLCHPGHRYGRRAHQRDAWEKNWLVNGTQ